MTEQLRQKWDNFADQYEKKFEKNSTVCYRILAPLLKLPTSSQILEVGCGTGNSIPILKSIVPDSVPITLSDFSPVFLSKLESKNFTNINFLQADNENLPFPDNSFDRFIANLSLQIVPSPDKMLSEAYRVLSPQGIAGFTVWGKASETNIFNILSKALQQAGFISEERSHFHLNNDAELRNRVKQAGFSKVFSIFSNVGVNVKSAEEYHSLFFDTPSMQALKKHSEDMYNNTLSTARNIVADLLNSGKSLTFEVLVVLAYK